MPGKQRGKMELPAGNANRRRLRCGGEAHGERRKLKNGGADIVKDVATTAARSAYKAKTVPLQAASMLVNKIAPGSKAAKGLKKAATPFKSGGKAKKRG